MENPRAARRTPIRRMSQDYIARLSNAHSGLRVRWLETGMKTTTAVTILAGIAIWPGAAQPLPRTRSFHFEYKAIVKDLAPGSKNVELWAPVPHDDEYQKITN